MPGKAKKTYGKYKQQINYMIFGLLTTVVNMIAYYALMLFSWFERATLYFELKVQDQATYSREIMFGYLAANLFAYIIAMIFSYVVNRNFVFKNKVSGTSAILRQFFLFLGTRIAALIAETALLFVAVDQLGISKFIAKWPVAIAMVLINYPLGKLVVFRDPDRKKSAKAD